MEFGILVGWVSLHILLTYSATPALISMLCLQYRQRSTAPSHVLLPSSSDVNDQLWCI